MLYIKNNYNVTHIVKKDETQKASKTALSIVKLLCEQQLFTYDSRIYLTKKHLDIKTKTPIYINKNILLIPTKSPKNYDSVWINYFEIFDYEEFEDKTVVLFNNLEEIIIDNTINSFRTSIRRAEKIIDYFYKRNSI